MGNISKTMPGTFTSRYVTKNFSRKLREVNRKEVINLILYNFKKSHLVRLVITGLNSAN